MLIFKMLLPFICLEALFSQMMLVFFGTFHVMTIKYAFGLADLTVLETTENSPQNS